MSSLITGALAYDGFSPGGPTNGKHQEFPFDWLDTLDATTGLPWYCPFYLTHDRAMEWHWRFRELTADFHCEVAGFTFDYEPTLQRVWTGNDADVLSEADLQYPGIRETDTYASPWPSPTRYRVTVNDDGWNGPDSTLELVHNVHLFTKQRLIVPGGVTDPEDIPHMLWQRDGLLIVPSVYVSGSLTFTTPGSEYAFAWSNAPLSSPTYQSACDVLPGHSGGSVDLDFSAATVNPTAFSLSIAPSLFWQWSKNGVPKWDSATGARL